MSRPVIVAACSLALLLLAFAPSSTGYAATPPVARRPTPPPAPSEVESPDADEPVVLFSTGGSWLGIGIADVDAARAKELGLKDERGAEIKEIVPGSPAAEAGLEEGEVILEYQGTPIERAAQLTRLVRETPAGRTVTLQVSRDGTTRVVKVKAGERRGGRGRIKEFRKERITIPPIEIPEIDIPEIDIPDFPEFGTMPSTVRLGAQVEGLTDQLGDYFGVKDGEGVLVRKVQGGGPGEAAGLKAGDVIIKVDGEAIDDPDDLRDALRDRRGKSVAVVVMRDRHEKTLTVALPKDDRPSDESALFSEGKQRLEVQARAIGERMKEMTLRLRELAGRMHGTI